MCAHCASWLTITLLCIITLHILLPDILSSSYIHWYFLNMHCWKFFMINLPNVVAYMGKFCSFFQLCVFSNCLVLVVYSVYSILVYLLLINNNQWPDMLEFFLLLWNRFFKWSFFSSDLSPGLLQRSSCIKYLRHLYILWTSLFLMFYYYTV